MWRMRLGLLGVCLLGGLGILFLYPSFQPSLALADPINQDSILTAGASSGAGIFISRLTVSAAAVPGAQPPALAPAEIALAATATSAPRGPNSHR